jgi:hypothetical protein
VPETGRGGVRVALEQEKIDGHVLGRATGARGKEVQNHRAAGRHKRRENETESCGES